MSLRLLRRTFSKVAVMAGTPQSDAKGAQIMKAIRAADPVVEFIGIGGPQMEKAGMFSSIPAKELPKKYFFPFANSYIDPRFFLSIFLIPENLRLISPIVKLYKSMFWKNFETENRKDVDMVVTLDNQLFAFRIFELMELYFKDNSVIRPLRVHVGSTIRNYNWDYLRSIDFLIYDLPIKSIDKQQFAYPSQYVGKQGVYDALKFIISSSTRHRNSIGQNYIDVDQDSIFEMTRQFRLVMRPLFREKIGVPENSILVFLAPGSYKGEISKNLRVISGALGIIKNNIKSDEILVPVLYFPEQTKEIEQMVKNSLEEFPVKVIYGSDSNERFEAMAASNFAAIQGDNTIFEAATFQLPTVVLDATNYFTAYVSMMHNVYSSEINRTVGGELFPEMTLWNFDTKLVEFWEQWIEKPEEKFNMAHRFSKYVLKMAPSDTDLKFSHQTNAALPSSQIRLYEPNFVRAEFLKYILVEFQKLKESKLSLGEQQLKRKEFILGPE